MTDNTCILNTKFVSFFLTNSGQNIFCFKLHSRYAQNSRRSCVKCLSLPHFNLHSNVPINFPHLPNVIQIHYMIWHCYIRTDGQVDMENLMHAFLQHFIAQLKQWISRVWKDICIYVSACQAHGCPPATYSFYMDTKNVSILDQCNQMCLLCFSRILSQEVRTIPVP